MLHFRYFFTDIKAKGALELFSCACNATLLHCMRMKKIIEPHDDYFSAMQQNTFNGAK